jgi:AraC-like DNA-binding protein
MPILVCLFWFVELIFTSGENRRAKRHLSFFMICGLSAFVGGLFYFKELYSVYAILYIGILVLSIAQVPALYLYLISLTENSPGVKTYYRHYAIPFISGISVIYFHYIHISQEELASLFSNYFITGELNQRQKVTYYADLTLRNGFVMLGIFYLILIHLKVKRHFIRVMNYYSDSEHKKLSWITISTAIYLLFVLVGATLFNPRSNPVIYNSEIILSIPFLLMAIIFWFIGYLGNRQQLNLIPSSGMEASPQAILTEDLRKDLAEKTILTIETDKLYLDPDLCLPDLARIVGTNRYYLSKIINDEFGMNFNNYINQYRISEAVELMKKNPDYSLSFISIQCGFNVYTSFVRNFKRFMRISPEKYRRKCIDADTTVLHD